MILAINYSNSQFTRKQKLNNWTALHIGKVDKVRSFTQADIDKDFYDEHKDTFSYQRGAGYWIWKPYIIMKGLEDIDFGEYLLYTDSGVGYLRKVEELIKKLSQSGQDMMLFELPLIEMQWTKKAVFDFFNLHENDILYSNQIVSGFLLLKKTPETISFIEEWLDLCKNRNLLYPEPSSYEYDAFIAHREDQSLLSVLTKSKGIKTFSDPTEYLKFPLETLSTGKYVYFREYEDLYKIRKPFFITIRRNGVIKYMIKYYIKSVLHFFGVAINKAL